MSESDQIVNCPTHGEAYPAYVCGHLSKDPNQQWFCDYPSEGNAWPDAWCAACDRAFQKEGEWNEKNEQVLDAKLTCHCCYEDRKGSSVSSLMDERSASWRPFVSAAVSELQTKQDFLDKEYGLFKHERWDWDQETRKILFSNAGNVALVARIQFVGSVATTSNTWLWSWANHSLDEMTYHELLTLRAFGEAEGFANLTVPKWPADETDGWEMAAVAAKVLDAQGAYRTPCDTGFLFMILKDVESVR